MYRPPFLSFIIAALLLTAGCANPSIRSYGYKIIETNADENVVASAVYNVVRDMEHQIPNGDGTFKIVGRSEHGESWSNSKGKLEAGRSRLHFQDKAGTKYTIERVILANYPTLILLDATETDAALNLHNNLALELLKQSRQRS